jgi:hypothetical protein
VGQMLRQVWGLWGKIICTKAVLLIIRVYIIWINLRNERTCYLIYWTALVITKYVTVDYDGETSVTCLKMLLFVFLPSSWNAKQCILIRNNSVNCRDNLYILCLREYLLIGQQWIPKGHYYRCILHSYVNSMNPTPQQNTTI